MFEDKPALVDRPPETREDGCPCGFIVNKFNESILPYIRGRSEHGVRNSNPLFDRANIYIQRRVLFFEHQQERLYAYAAELQYEYEKRQSEITAKSR